MFVTKNIEFVSILNPTKFVLKLLLQYVLLPLLLCHFVGCSSPEQTEKPLPIKKIAAAVVPKIKECHDCHPFTLDRNHAFACTTCHAGKSGTNSAELAHENLISEPSSPNHMAKTCGNCHPSILNHIQGSKHFTLADEVNLVRKAFGANETILDPRLIPDNDLPQTALELADDLLRRRCLRCHVFSSGDTYQGTQHGTGCSACHLKFRDGALLSHEFIRLPDDQICLSCHHGNFVGADYYGLFEHDYNWEYHTPFAPNEEKTLPFGVDYHQLRPDVHQTAGLGCIDCHSGDELMGQGAQPITCEKCHASKSGTAPQTMTTKISQKTRTIPQIDSATHGRKNTSCQVCHAQWSFVDSGTNLMRIDNEEYDGWAALTKQGSSEVEQLLELNLFTDNDTEPVMTDQFSRAKKQGIWLKGFFLRRWEDIPTCLDEKDVLQVCRPILDLSLSYVNEDGEVIIDAAQGTSINSGMKPYAPHTIGKAGAFPLKGIKRPGQQQINLTHH